MTTVEARAQPPAATTAGLGAHYDGDGTRFALYSSLAERVELCLFDDELETRVALQQGAGSIWEGYLDHLSPGQPYGYRIHGPWDPANGARCNPAKLLLDPYARAVAGHLHWHPAVYGHQAGDRNRPDPADSAPFVPRSIVAAHEHDWDDDRRPGHAMADSIFYEVHVERFTSHHPGVPESLRGTYAALAEPAVVDHLRCLGVTAVELLPVHQFVHDAVPVGRGLRNCSGYQPVGYFAPHNEYSSAGERGQQVGEFRRMVRALHAGDVEVILAVVFNRTAEGNENGPTLCLRGIDNSAYYRLANDRSRYVDDTGCGNTVDLLQAPALRMVMDALRYWVQDMHVDGFRFDLAASLGRAAGDFEPWSSFVQAVGLDPVLATVKLIAEPRGVGQEGLVKGAAMQQVDLEVAFQTAEHQHHGVLHHSTLLALEAEVIAALDAAVAAFDRAVQLLNYPAGAVSPTPGVDGAFCTELSHRTLAMLGSAHPDDLRRAAALLHVTACVKRVVAHCARLAGLAPMLAPLLSGDPGIRRTSELEVLATRHRLVLARDAVGVIAASPGAASVRTPAAPQSQAGGQSCTILALAAAGRAGRPSLAAGDSALARLAELLDQINLEAGYIDEEATSVTVGLFIEMA